jgi:hypothetical protein
MRPATRRSNASTDHLLPGQASDRVVRSPGLRWRRRRRGPKSSFSGDGEGGQHLHRDVMRPLGLIIANNDLVTVAQERGRSMPC